jgi:hypothetical protein
MIEVRVFSRISAADAPTPFVVLPFQKTGKKIHF